MYRASRTVKEGLSRCFLGHGSKPWVPSTSAGGLRELLSVPLRSQGYPGVGRALSGLHWVWCNRRGPHLEWRQEPQGSSPFLTLIAGSLQSWDRNQSVPAGSSHRRLGWHEYGEGGRKWARTQGKIGPGFEEVLVISWVAKMGVTWDEEKA